VKNITLHLGGGGGEKPGLRVILSTSAPLSISKRGTSHLKNKQVSWGKGNCSINFDKSLLLYGLSPSRGGPKGRIRERAMLM